MKLTARGHTFNRRDLVSVLRNRKHQTGVNPDSIHKHCTSAALSVIATFFRSREMQPFP
jgi:hypothetical protein